MIPHPCPACAHPLKIPNALGGRVARCPACQQRFYVPENLDEAPEPADYVPTFDQVVHVNTIAKNQGRGQGEGEQAAVTQKCPRCGAAWFEGAKNCYQCHYNAAAIEHRQKAKGLRLFYMNYQQIATYVLILALIFGGYMFYDNWAKIRHRIINFMDSTTPQEDMIQRVPDRTIITDKPNPIAQDKEEKKLKD
jgi:uncharacterized Zn finger protein (UPF0148 family)